MKRLIFLFYLLSSLTLHAQKYIADWGLTGCGSEWPILNDSSTVDGDASIGADGPPVKDWATIRGGFGEDVEIPQDEAVLVSGRLEYVGGGTGNSYMPLRFALTFLDSATLENQYTDSAKWVSPVKHYGYEFTPRTGTAVQPNGTGGNGSVWTVINGIWCSTYSNGGGPVGPVVQQLPRNAEIREGIYDWAISVQLLGDGTNEIRWYLVEENQKYWFGGSVIDTAQITTKFNGICFGLGTDITTSLYRFNLTEARVDKGDPIDLPTAIVYPYYLDQWGATERGNEWPILNDSIFIDGNASMGGDEPPAAWATIRGGFGMDIQSTTDKAIVVSGQLEYVGGSAGNSFLPLRFALTYQEDEGTLKNQYTDSAAWTGTGSHKGYEFTPRSGTADMASGTGGIGTVWTVINGNWNSTYGNNGLPLAIVNQSPRDAEIIEGVYDWAIAVQPKNDGSNEIRWYLYEKNYKYAFAGTAIDTTPVITKFNGICFGIGEGITSNFHRFNLKDVKVELADLFPLPPPPPHTAYLDNWGIIGDKFGGWTTVPGELVGNVSVLGTIPNAELVAVQGGFYESIAPSEEKSLKIDGSLELTGGGFEAANSLRFGIFYSKNVGALLITPVDSMRWSGSEDQHSGYLFIPPSGTNKLAEWGDTGEAGSWGTVLNNLWFEPKGGSNYAIGSTVQYPAKAIAGEGKYDFAISISVLEDSSREIRFKLLKKDKSYGFAGFAIDKYNSFDTKSFNCIAFALDSGNTTTAVHIRDVRLNMDQPVTLPEWVTSVGQQKSPAPREFSLSQNFPNPFNPVTQIEYSIPYISEISLKVYNLLGQEVETLFEGWQKAGTHTVLFDGSGLSGGVYYYRLKAKGFMKTNKFILLK